MKIRHSDRFKAQLRGLAKPIRKKLYKQSEYLLRNLQHPSLRAKKYDETRDIWQARIDRSYRFYFTIDGDTYILTELIKHED